MYYGQIKSLRQTINKKLKSRRSISTYWENEFIRNPYFNDVYITVDLMLGNGKTVRLAINTCEVSIDDSSFVYLPFLIEEPVISSSYDLLSGDGNQRSIGLQIDGRVIEAAKLVSQGTFITGFAEISLQKNGGDFNKRLILMRGTIGGGISFGVKDEPISLTIVDSVISNDLYIPPYLILRDPDFPDLPDDKDGKRFPIIIGKYSGGVPCIRITRNEYGPNYLIAYGHSIQVNSIRINTRTIPYTDTERGWSIETDTTPSGIPYTYIDFIFPASLADPNNPNQDLSEDYKYKWADGNISVFADVVNNQSLQSDDALDQMRDLLITYSGFGQESFDEDLFARSRSRSPSLKIQTLINASDSDNTTTVLQYVQNTFTDQLPMMSLLYGRTGIGIIFTDRRAKPLGSTYIIGKSEILDRVSLVQESPSENIYNSFLLKYAYNTADDTYTKTIKVDYTNNSLCNVSYYKLGLREYEVIESVSIFDDLTAAYIVNWLASHLSLPKYTAEYVCSPNMFLQVRVGDNITITDNDLGWQNVNATITSINYNKNSMTIKLDIWILYNQIENISGY